ncbi:MAG: DUF2491 family protein [Opitutales bacterium]
MISFFKKKEEEPVLPLGLRVGAPVEISEFAFMEVAVEFAKEASSLECVVERLESFDLGEDGVMLWAYLSNSEGILHVYADTEGQIEELRLYRTVHVETPSTQEEWAFWEEELIGFIRFQMSDQIMPEAPIYDRMWQAEGAEQIAAMTLEARTHPLEKDAPLVEHRAMRYARLICEEPVEKTEWLDIVISEDEDEAWIDIRIGYDLKQGDITVL